MCFTLLYCVRFLACDFSNILVWAKKLEATFVFINILLIFTVCNGLGMGNLDKILSVNATNIDTFKNCTKINGNIAIIYTSIHG